MKESDGIDREKISSTEYEKGGVRETREAYKFNLQTGDQTTDPMARRLTQWPGD